MKFGVFIEYDCRAANQVMSEYGITIKLDVKPMHVDPVVKKWYEDAMEKSH